MLSPSESPTAAARYLGRAATAVLPHDPSAVVPAVTQAPAAQEAVASYLAGRPSDFNGISVQNLKARFDSGYRPFILDAREPSEFEAGHLDGAVNVPIRTLAQNLAKLPAKNVAIVTYCAIGTRAPAARSRRPCAAAPT